MSLDLFAPQPEIFIEIEILTWQLALKKDECNDRTWANGYIRGLEVALEMTICESFESIKDFYRLNCLTRRMHGLPPQPFSFFKKIHEHIICRMMYDNIRRLRLIIIKIKKYFYYFE